MPPIIVPTVTAEAPNLPVHKDVCTRIVAAAFDMHSTTARKAKIKKAVTTLPLLNLKPNHSVTVVARTTQLQSVQMRLREAIVIGLHTEPPVSARTPAQPVSVLTIAMRNAAGQEEAFVWDLLALSPSDYDDVLAELFASVECAKLGLSFLPEFQGLQDAYPSASCFGQLEKAIEVNKMLQQLTQSSIFLSLEKLVSVCLQQRLPRASSWHERPLLAPQCTVAGLHALALLWIHDVLAPLLDGPIDTFLTSWTLGGKAKIECPSCNRKYKSPMALSQHAAGCVPKADWKHACPTCRRRFRTDISLKQHLCAVPAPKGDFICSVCHRAFTTQIGLEHHTATHAPPATEAKKKTKKTKKKRTCEHCKSKFSTNAAFKRHSDTCETPTTATSSKRATTDAPKAPEAVKAAQRDTASAITRSTTARSNAAKTSSKKLNTKPPIKSEPTKAPQHLPSHDALLGAPITFDAVMYRYMYGIHAGSGMRTHSVTSLHVPLQPATPTLPSLQALALNPLSSKDFILEATLTHDPIAYRYSRGISHQPVQ
ncbi:hypothetical protein ACHHYP_05363 [Achlya hypogyna]|uniref:C2H2-type domain-containing protein n=1 Tax=Achlya hypogyna TaxID=1202772 RepID=A0A1V9YXT7_ACHHY|nr:hypothetical protein ACHHYP_05363 [Achlya hypogyna]